MIQIWQVPSECGPSNLVVLELTNNFLPMSYETVVTISWSYRVSHIEVYKVNLLWQIFNFISLAACSGGNKIWVLSTSYQRSIIGCPQQPPKERVSDIIKKLDFWWSITQKKNCIGHFCASNDPTIRISNFFEEMRPSRSLRPLRLLRL